jgi:hypothetical protein
MKHTQTIIEPATQRIIVTHTTCDLCSKTIEHDCFEVDDVVIRHQVGSSYPEGSLVEETTVDMCGECFKSKLVPWLQSQGVTPTTSQSDW